MRRFCELSTFVLCLAAGVSASLPAPAATTQAARTAVPPQKQQPAGGFFIADCLDFLGGGNVTNDDGIFPRAAVDGCGGQLASYLSSGAYMKGIELAVQSAYKALGMGPAQPVANTSAVKPPAPKLPTASATPAAAAAAAAAMAMLPVASTKEANVSSRLVVFDIDETLLSNVMANPAFFTRGRRLLADADALGPAAMPPQGMLPAIKPMAALYKALCQRGHPVALITGRQEKKRNATAANLAQAGLGSPCASGKLTRSSSDGSECCYMALVLRKPGDNSLASIYKPRARGQLAKRYGFDIYAAFGDQFSDLNGEHPPAFAFKLPNPFYAVL